MRVSTIFLFFVLSLCAIGEPRAQDFFEEEEDSVMWFYDYSPKLSVLYLHTLHYSPYGAAIWVHHKRYKFSSYFEFKGNYRKQQSVSAVNSDETSVMQVSADKLDFIGGVGVGSTIYENYLWYFNIGAKYSNYFVDYDYVPGHKIKYESPLRIHYGGGISAIFFEHLQAQIGLDFETFLITGGVGFVF